MMTLFKIASAKTNTINCPICDCNQYKSLFRFGTRFFPLNIALCTHCGFIFQNPRVTEDTWTAYYETGIYDKYHRPRPAQNAVPSNITAGAVYERIMDFLTKQYKKHDGICFDPQNPDAKRVCEIGAGQGNIIEIFKGMKLYAIEPSSECQKILIQKGVVVLTDPMHAVASSNPKTFDIIIMRHVLEHIYYPQEILRNVISMLSDDGILYVAVPNILSKEYIGRFTYPHISYFSRYSLAFLSHNLGLEVCVYGELEDEIWLILKKKKARNKTNKTLFKETYGGTSNNLLRKNIEVTKHLITNHKKHLILIKRSSIRILSHFMPDWLLMTIYSRRDKNPTD